MVKNKKDIDDFELEELEDMNDDYFEEEIDENEDFEISDNDIDLNEIDDLDETIYDEDFDDLIEDEEIDENIDFDELEELDDIYKLDDIDEFDIDENDNYNIEEEIEKDKRDFLDDISDDEVEHIEKIYIYEDKKDSETDKVLDNCNIMNLYLKDLKQYKVLSREEEIVLIKKIKQDNDEEAKKMMILCNLRLVISVAKRLMGQGLPLIDMISEGNLGLIRAIEKFDVNKGYRFSTYAVWWIRQTIKKAIINKGRDIRIPTYKHEKLSKMTKIISEYKLINGKSPSLKYLEEALNETPEKIQELFSEFQEIVSFSDPIGDNLYFEDVIGVSTDIEDQMFKEKQIQEIEETMNRVLNDREISVIKHRYGLSTNKIKTLKEIGMLLDVTRERVRQIEKKALYKLQQHLKK